MTNGRRIRYSAVACFSLLFGFVGGAHPADLKPGQVPDQDIIVKNILELPREKFEVDWGSRERVLWHFKDGRVFEMIYAEYTPSTPGEHPLNYHLWEEITYIVDGTGYSEIKKLGESVRKVEWQKGSMVFIPAMAGHNWVATTPAKLLSFANSLQIDQLGLSKASTEFDTLLKEKLKEKK